MPFQHFNKVWVKVKGYPWWPAMVLPVEDVPENIRKMKPKSGTQHVCYFYGTHDYGWFTESNMQEFEANFDKFKENKKPPAHFLEAIEEATDPTFVVPRASIHPPIEEEEEVEPEQEKKGRKSKKRSRAGEDEDAAAPKKKSKRGTKDTTAGETKKRESKKAKQEVVEETKSPFDRLLRLRMKLQKFMQMDTTARTSKDFEKAASHLSEVEVFPVTFELLKETKVGKVIKRLSAMDFGDDRHNIAVRCREILANWQKNSDIAQQNSAQQETEGDKAEEAAKEEEESKEIAEEGESKSEVVSEPIVEEKKEENDEDKQDSEIVTQEEEPSATTMETDSALAAPDNSEEKQMEEPSQSNETA